MAAPDRPAAPNRLARAWRRSARPADQATVRRSNLSLVLQHLHDLGPRSRATIAAQTGLNKATVSSLVAELQERGLVLEVGAERAGAVGRPALILELDGSGVGAVGLEVNVDYLAALATDLAGRILYERRVAYDSLGEGPAASLDALARLAGEALAAIAAQRAVPAGVTVAVPGLVDVARGVVTFAPNLHWHGVWVADHLRGALGNPPYPITVDNDANLSALAEYWVGAEAGTADLVYLTGEVGVGGGVIVDGRLLRGAEGFSGEVGHMPVDPRGPRCGCGRRGCWETLVGMTALLRLAADPDDTAVHGAGLDPEDRLAEVLRRAEAGDRRTLDALDEIGRLLGFGASILVNLFNPRVIVLGGYFARVGRHVIGAATTELRLLAIAPNAGGCHVELSTLGFSAAVRGGAGLAVEAVLADPTLVPRAALAAAEPPATVAEGA
jgi:predicted NBD/HSP70 family sugar kinase